MMFVNRESGKLPESLATPAILSVLFVIGVSTKTTLATDDLHPVRLSI